MIMTDRMAAVDANAAALGVPLALLAYTATQPPTQTVYIDVVETVSHDGKGKASSPVSVTARIAAPALGACTI